MGQAIGRHRLDQLVPTESALTARKVASLGQDAYADLCGGTAIYRSLSFWRETFAPNGRLQGLCIDRLVFAIDMDISRSDYVDGCRPYFEFYDNLFDAIGATESQREQVNRGTALRLFGLD